MAGSLWVGLRGRLDGERDRWALWLPVAFGAGIGGYFQLASEPPMWLGVAAAGVSLAGLVVLRRTAAGVAAAAGLFLASAGFLAAELRSDRVAAPVLERRLGPTVVEARVLGVDKTANGYRLLLDRLAIDGLSSDRTPRKLRLSLRNAAEPNLVPGQRVRLRAMLRPASPPAAPGAFDFQRFLYFAGVGATGTGFAPIAVLPEVPDQALDAAIWIARLRTTITRRILAVLPGDVGAVTAALIAGDESKISSAMHQAYRDSGLAHLLSISGLHIAIVAGFVMFLVRAALALCEPIALRFPIKKWAALAALAAAGAYALLAGWTVPTQRSFLMSALVLVALTIDRSAISLRVVAWSAIVVLAFMPEALLNPSFQMSYGAVIALIAGYEIAQPAIARWRAETGWWRYAALYVGGLVFSSLLATAATSPFAAFHFNRIALFGLVANMVAVPLSGVLVMPAGLIGVLLMPFGWEAIGLVPMGWGIAIINWVAVEVAAWPAAVIKVPAFPIEALAAITLGALWISLWRTRWRWWGFVGVAVGCLAAALARPPDLLVSPDGGLMAVNPSGGPLMLSTLKGQRFMADAWLARFAEDQPAALAAATPGTNARCDRFGCVYRAGRHVVALVTDPRGLPTQCRGATIVISAVPVRGRCRSAITVIDRFDLWRAGAHALWLHDDAVTVQSVRDYRGVRPWALAPEQRRRTEDGGAPLSSGATGR
ncbi:MAG: ComEC/Rec2 family competence protein [Proteobacteria bacterium]|nr:ComEC/Rec2 family competence protein [Pseudomonadota bacterium]